MQGRNFMSGKVLDLDKYRMLGEISEEVDKIRQIERDFYGVAIALEKQLYINEADQVKRIQCIFKLRTLAAQSGEIVKKCEEYIQLAKELETT